MNEPVFDAIVVGSGITGGWAAKELTERGLRVLMIERGRNVTHGKDYVTEHVPVQDMKFRMLGDQRLYQEQYPVQSRSWFFNEGSQQFFVNDIQNPYSTPPDQPFTWIRSHQLGGRSLVWGRQSYRMAALNFEENAKDGHGVAWPIGYDDLDPWYGHVESFIGVSGSRIGNAMSPDGVLQPTMPLNVVEREFQRRMAQAYPDRPVTDGRVANLTEPLGGRAPCHYCGPCVRGCSAGAYFCTQASTLPAALATGNLTVKTDSIVTRLLLNDETGRINGVEVLDAHSRTRSTISAGMVFLCASAFESIRLLLNSSTSRFPNGLANSSGVLGHYVMDHCVSDVLMATTDGPNMPHLNGYRPSPMHMPRFRNVDSAESGFVRGYQYNAGARAEDWERGVAMRGVGKKLKHQLRRTGQWTIFLLAQCECLPVWNNQIEIDPDLRDEWGVPALKIAMSWSENEFAMMKDAGDEGSRMFQRAGYENIQRIPMGSVPGAMIHEMGGAPMGSDPKSSVLNAHNQSHDIPNLFLTDGAAMNSSSSANPSLTYMAITARAAAYAADVFKKGRV